MANSIKLLGQSKDDENEDESVVSGALEKHFKKCIKCSIDEITFCDELLEEFEAWDVMDALRK